MSEETVPELKRYEFKRILEELQKKRGRGTELISVYIPPGKQVSDVVGQLREERGQASNIKSKSTRVNVQGALDSILSRLQNVRSAPAKGVVIFCGAIEAGRDKTDMETYIVEPLEPISIYKYHCDSAFFVEPLLEQLEEKRIYGLLVLDRREATLGLLKGRRIEPLRHLTSTVPGKIRKGGQSAMRFQRLREQAIEDFFQRIGKHANEVFLPEKRVVAVLVGGTPPTRDDFIKGGYLHYELQKKIQGPFDVSYTDESGLPELVDRAGDVLKGMDLMTEKALVERFMRELAKPGGAVSYGEPNVRENLKLGSVETLLLSEDLRRLRVKARCPQCATEAMETLPSVDDVKPCPKCGARREAVEYRDVVAELTDLAKQTGSQVQLVSTEFEEGAQLKNAFGGIAALLRYSTQV